MENNYRLNKFRTFSSLCPIYLANSSGPLTDIVRKFHELAILDTRNVLPVPGEPYSKTPA